MTQRIFDVDNEKDYADLWDIVPENIVAIEKSIQNCAIYRTNLGIRSGYQYININWHDKKEIIRPIQEATEADVGKLCYFWDCEDKTVVSVYKGLDCDGWFLDDQATCWKHCRRLTADEVKELC